jgi:predicted PurR-regulated permease PerM
MPLSKRRKIKKAQEVPMVQVSFSGKSLLKILLVFFAGWIAFLLKDLIFLVVLAIILAVLIDPLADWFEKRHIPRGFGVIVVYLFGFVLITAMALLIMPPVIEQTKAIYDQYEPIISSLPIEDELARFFLSGEVFSNDLRSLVDRITRSGILQAYPQIINLVSNAVNVVASAILVLVLAFFAVIEEKKMREMFVGIVPGEHRMFAEDLMFKIKMKLGRWLRGQLLLMVSIFILTFVSLSLLQMPYALVLALIAGLLEAVIYIGPILATVPAVLIALSVSPLLALIVLIVYFLIQQIESDLLTPKIMQKMAGMNPIVTIVAVIAFYEFFGIIGALLAVPLAMLTGLVIKEIRIYSQL